MYPKKSVECEMKEVVHEEEFFYSFQNLPCVLDDVFPEFLDARDDLAIYEDNSIHDLLQLDLIYRARFVVDAVGTHSTELSAEYEANLLPSEKAMDLLTGDSWLMSVVTDDMSVLTGMSSGPPGPLINRGDNSSSDNSDVDQDNAMYYPWENDIDANIDEKKERKAQSETVICSLTGFINLVLLSVLALATIIIQWGARLFQNAAVCYVLNPSWRAIFLPLFWINTVLWDAVG
jgi:hypothetical protein